MNNYNHLINKIEEKTAIVGVIGLGYVGLPLALEFAKAGYTVYGFDVNEKKVQDLLNGESYIIDVPNEELKTVVESKNFIPTTDFSLISKLDTVSICVPTPLTKSQDPDMSYVISAVSTIKSYMSSGILITLESTTYPGTTEDLIEKELQIEGYKVGEDYFLCFSPERVDPGNKKFNTKNTPKVLGGTTNECTELGVILYTSIIDKIVPVSSPKVAEMSKLLENTFRSINIAFINEMAMLCDKLGIDIWETIEAANTKPFGYMKFTPGPGIGGHCIPLDPMYLSWKAKEANFYSRFIELAQEVNKTMPSYVLGKVGEALNNVSKPIRGSKVLILGMAYKPDIDDLRESPSLEIYELLKNSGAEVDFHDPHAISFIDKNESIVHSKLLDYEMLNDYDCILLLTNHTAFDYKEIEKYSQIIVDTRDAFREIKSEKVFKIGSVNKNYNLKLPVGN
ncbi:nucleotide sugar dehydrogenase [Bacillus infantis]|uniref:nucleotide sugar dehydrogenase n=1 Tax=Bacillus infantis TaxID=324767 RepID=UPI001CD58764|nr:nucleotide sugar dehydrogenase [Bacillus infantis]MCA1041616.1 nucleotide sugar dehydrogenase [Bacillus infantis]